MPLMASHVTASLAPLAMRSFPVPSHVYKFFVRVVFGYVGIKNLRPKQGDHSEVLKILKFLSQIKSGITSFNRTTHTLGPKFGAI